MFGSLRKRLKEAVEKVSRTISGGKEQTEELKELRRDEELSARARDEMSDIVHDEGSLKDDTASMKEPVQESHHAVHPHHEEKREEVISEEARVISGQEPFASIAKEEEKEKIEEQLEKLIEEEGENKETAKEEAMLLAEEEPFKTIVEEETEIEEKQQAEEKSEDIIEESFSEIETETTPEEKEDLGEIQKLIEEAPLLPMAKVAPEKFSFVKKITEKKLSDNELDDVLKEMELALLENDVSVDVTELIMIDMREKLSGTTVKRGKVEETIKEALRNAILHVMKQEHVNLEKLIEGKEGPFTIMLVGFNGVGKTTTLAKLANRFKDYNPVLAAADTFRAASIEQLEEHGKKLGLRVIKHTYGSDAAAVIFDAKKHAGATQSKLVLADTAGRAHNNANLMDELKKIARVNAPDFKILVLDSITGNDIYDQCKLFNDAIGVDAIILTKADVYERGGAALSASYTLKKPILYLGTGQEYGDLKAFNPEEIVENLLG